MRPPVARPTVGDLFGNTSTLTRLRRQFSRARRDLFGNVPTLP
jgi:hypothetical protein